MTREKLPDRRPSVTKKIAVTLDGGKEVHLFVTVGFADDAMTLPREVFCADMRTGTALHTMIIDSCILLSRLLQHGELPENLADTLCQPPGLIGAIANVIVTLK